MTVLMIAGSVCLLVVILLLFPVSVSAEYGEKLSVKARYFFLQYRFLPRPEKKKKPEQQEEEKKPAGPKPSKIRELFQKRGISGFLSLLRAFTRVAVGSAKKLLSHVVIGSLSLELSVGGEDAARTALNYGGVCGLVSTALSVLLSNTKCRQHSVQVIPDFQSKTGMVRFSVRLRIRLIFLLSAAVSALIGLIKIYLKDKKESGSPDQKEKAVFSHGGTSD